MTAISTLPVEQVKALDPARVAGWLGLEPSKRERHKFPCIWCESGDALDLKPGKLPKCFSCGKSGSVVDVAMQRLGLEFVEAVKWLADCAGILVPQTGYEAARVRAGYRPAAPPACSSPANSLADQLAVVRPGPQSDAVLASIPGQPGEPSPNETPAAHPADPFSWGDGYEPDASSPARQRVAVYTALVELFPPGTASLTYLAGRKLAYPDTLRELRFFEITDWDRAARTLLDRFSREMLTAAFPPNDTGKFPRPFGGRPVLGMSYQYDGEVYAVRFRNLDPRPEKQNRYRDCNAVPPVFPWHADSLRDVASHDLHVVEGELNGLSLWGLASHLRVVALPGAGRIPGAPIAPWLRAAGQARRVVCWFDADQAGDAGALGFARSLARANSWSGTEARQRIVRARPLRSGDLNDLLARGQLDAIAAELLAAA